MFDDSVANDFDFDQLKRLGQEVECAESYRFYGGFYCGIARHDDDIAVRIPSSSGFENFNAIGARRHHQVGKDNVEFLAGFEETQGFGPVFSGSDAETAGLHVFAECQPKVTVVVDDKQPSFPRVEIRNLDRDGQFGKAIENFRFRFYNE